MRRKVAYTSRLKEGSPAEERGESASVERAEGGPAAQPQNALAAGKHGHGAGDGGPQSEHPLNRLAPSHTPGNSVAGPAVSSAPDTPIPHAGTGGQGKPGAHGGLQSGHPLNIVEPTRAGHGQGTAGGRAIERPIDRVQPAKAAKQPNPVDKKAPHRKTPAKAAAGSNRISKGATKNLGHFLGKVGAGRPN